MIWLILFIFFILLMLAPNWYVKAVLRKHGATRHDFPGNGAELARHLVARFQLDEVKVVESETGDFYDPALKEIHLSQPHFQERSVSAIAVACHEFSHALQHARQESAFARRQTLAVIADRLQRITPILFTLLPIMIMMVKLPLFGFLYTLTIFVTFATSILVHLVTLPVEWDASFGKALPILQEGNYLQAQDLQAAKDVLRAAAFTYVAASLASLLNFGVWMRYLRRF